jgi:hypothetical protein
MAANEKRMRSRRHSSTVGSSTGSRDTSRSLYDASPTNGTSRLEAPPEGEQGIKSNTAANPPRKPTGN